MKEIIEKGIIYWWNDWRNYW